MAARPLTRPPGRVDLAVTSKATGRNVDAPPGTPGAQLARRRRKRDERQRPTQRAVTPAGGGASSLTEVPPPTAESSLRVERPHASRAGTLCAMSSNGDGGLSLPEAAAARRRVAGHAAAVGARGLIPQYDGGAGRRRRSATPGSWRGSASAATRSGTSAARPRRAGWRSATSRSCFPRSTIASTRSARPLGETGLEPALIERVVDGAGDEPRPGRGAVLRGRVQLLRYVAAVLAAGLPLVAMLQLVRVYGQAMAQVADAEVRLFHLYVHEPLMRSGADRDGDGRGDARRSPASCCRWPRR